jgi:hypothetical protein
MQSGSGITRKRVLAVADSVMPMVTVGGFVLLVTGASTATGSVMLGIAVIYYIARFWPRRRP